MPCLVAMKRSSHRRSFRFSHRRSFLKKSFLSCLVAMKNLFSPVFGVFLLLPLLVGFFFFLFYIQFKLTRLGITVTLFPSYSECFSFPQNLFYSILFNCNICSNNPCCLFGSDWWDYEFKISVNLIPCDFCFFDKYYIIKVEIHCIQIALYDQKCNRT